MERKVWPLRICATQVVTTVLLAALLTACELFPRRFDVTLPENRTVEPGAAVALPVVVLDHTGLVTGLEAGPAGRGRSLALRQHPTLSTTVIAEWPGGGCERSAVLELRRTQAGYRLTLGVAWDKDQPCAVSPANRELHIMLSEHVDPADIEFVPEGGLLDPPSPGPAPT